MLRSVGNVRLMQKINREKVLSYIRKNSPVSRTELADVTGLSLSSITNIISYLMELGLVSETGRIHASGAGRRAALIEFNAGAMKLVAINIEAEDAEIALTDLNGGIISYDTLKFDGKKDPNDIIGLIERKTYELIEQNHDVKAISFAVSGHVSAAGEVSSCIMNWDRVDVKSRFERATGLQVYISNNTKTKGLWTISALNDQEHRNVVFLDMSDGIGIACAYDGVLSESVTGELGHIAVAKDGPKCFCGNRGCLESVCSVEYVTQRYFELSGQKLGFQDICDADSDSIAASVLDEVAGYLGAALTNVIAIFEPDLIIVNSSELFGVPRLYNTAVSRAIESGARLAMKRPELLKVTVSSHQSAQGAAQLAADRILGIDGLADIL